MPTTTYKWTQGTGKLSLDGKDIATGYAGAPGYKNDPAAEQLHNRGPLPRGWYTITLIYPSHAKFGPNCCVLTPDRGNKMYGRSGFLIHADSIHHPGQASAGCIVVDSSTRRLFRVGDRLEVV